MNGVRRPASLVLGNSRAADAGLPVLTLHLEQKPKLGARVYRLFVNDGRGLAKGEQIGFARQKLRARREHFTLYSDDAKTTVLAEAKPGKIFEFGATYVVTDPAGVEVGRFCKLGKASLLMSSYVLSRPTSPSPSATSLWPSYAASSASCPTWASCRSPGSSTSTVVRRTDGWS